MRDTFDQGKLGGGPEAGGRTIDLYLEQRLEIGVPHGLLEDRLHLEILRIGVGHGHGAVDTREHVPARFDAQGVCVGGGDGLVDGRLHHAPQSRLEFPDIGVAEAAWI
ncbi:MAG: hypothetical protein HC869_08605, partial [Rhodospirillales bacterium]|nr:hypothetical protein [Rhodospirillales bacterium]